MIAAWKLIPTVLMVGALGAGALLRPPREPVPASELARLVIAVAALYVVGGIAIVDHRTGLACIVFGAGLALCALALWLSRGSAPPRDDEDEEGGGDGGSPPLEPGPSGPSFDWAFYEDQFGGEPSPAGPAPPPQPTPSAA